MNHIKDGQKHPETIRLILASNSPRRKWLLSSLGLKFEIYPAEIDESRRKEEHPVEYVSRVAEEKARWVAKKVRKPAVIIAADTTVADGNRILGKPVDEVEAKKILLKLRGRSHAVYTGLCLLEVIEKTNILSDNCETEVLMRKYSETEIEEYIAGGDPLDKAGAYAIQHSGFQPVERINGCYANVVGLPLCHLAKHLKQFGIIIERNIPDICMDLFQFSCSISAEILETEE